MLTVRRAEDRGHADHGWLSSHHTFSFADFYDPRFMGFGPLRVINDDTVAAGGGFPTHGHRDMEIISYVLEGALEHKDSLGTGSVIRPGDVQRMSAGTGVRHSEFNASDTSPVHFLQIWLLPRREGLPAGYEQKHFAASAKQGRLCLVASPDGAEGSVRIQQDARMFATLLAAGQSVSHAVKGGRKGWLHVARGAAAVNGLTLKAGDGVAISGEESLTISSPSSGEVLLFDLGA
ncbi:MAG TPA: pirin family protein [Pseudomonadota bacterium]|nr:pirin family protein [Pseudomonadota bacterium]